MTDKDFENTTKEELREMYEQAESELKELEKDIQSVQKDLDEAEARIEQLEEELEGEKPQTLVGEMKKEILRKLYLLPLQHLQDLEAIEAPHILGFETSLD